MESNTHADKRSNHKLGEKEPLFIEDRTQNFQLDYAIQFKSQSNANNKTKSNKGNKNNACWNCCSTDHALFNCPQPRNHQIISQNRYAFQVQKQRQLSKRYGPGGQRSNRYFFANDLCSHFTPGILSDDLLNALDVPNNGIPLHVYKMRKYGYPSGWLEEARDEFSGISIFTAPNECLPLPGRDKTKDNIFLCNLNERKLHKYPGFNAPCPPGVCDEYEKLGCPEYSPDQSLNLMYERLKTNNLIVTSAEGFPENKSEIIVDLKAPTKKRRNSIPEVTDNLYDEIASSPEDGEITDEDDCDKNSIEPVLNETNELKSTILVDMQDNSEICVNSEESIDDQSLTDSIIESVSTPQSLKRKFGDVKSEVLGTPVVKHISTYVNRPAHEKFAKGMVDLIDHENLPNAVGTFKKLNEILKDVRKTMNSSM